MDDTSRAARQQARRQARRQARAEQQAAADSPDANQAPHQAARSDAATDAQPSAPSQHNQSGGGGDDAHATDGKAEGGKGGARKGGKGGGKGAGGKAHRQADTDDSADAIAEALLPPAQSAQLRPRHYGVLTGLVALVVLPLIVIGAYLFIFAQDQYASSTGFTVRSEETSSATEIAGGLSSIIGGPSSSNGDVLFAYVQSQQIVQRVQEDLDLRTHFSENWRSDPVFSLWPDATIEDLLWFWGRMVRVSYDKASGLMNIQVRARTPEFAQQIAQAIVRESEAMINELNRQARSDSMANAQLDLAAAVERLRAAREDLAAFRARTQIVDPTADIQGRMGVINNLQQQLAQSLVDHDLLLQNTTETDPRVRQALRRIEVIEERINSERLSFATQDVTVFDTDYPRLIAQFESLMVNQDFAERTYTAALTALDAARSNAERQSLYLATYIRPTLAQQAEYPQRFLLLSLSFLFLFLIWASLTLIYYSLRDRG